MTQGETDQRLGPGATPAGRLLFGVLGGFAAWTVHFLLSYAIASIGCVEGWRGLREILALETALLAGIALWSTAVAWRDWRRVSPGQPWDSALNEPRGWFAFLMVTGALLGLISTLAIVLEGFGTLMLPVCGWNVR
jgi:hypothetical protein